MTDIDWVALRAPFPPNEIGKLPKAGIELDYVSHAFVTERLNEFGGDWSMEPVGDVQFPGPDLCWLQVRLIVGGVARYEVGCADPRKQEFPKLLWSDCLTRAAMRHGIALALWQKETMVVGDRPTGAQRPPTSTRAPSAVTTTLPDPTAQYEQLKRDVALLDVDGKASWDAWKVEWNWEANRVAGTLSETGLLASALEHVAGCLALGTTEPFEDVPTHAP